MILCAMSYFSQVLGLYFGGPIRMNQIWNRLWIHFAKIGPQNTLIKRVSKQKSEQ